MGFLSKLFPGPKELRETVGAVGDVIDKFRYRKEEQARDQAEREDAEMAHDLKVREMELKVMDTTIEWQRATEGQNVTRRMIAIGVFLVWLLAFVASSVATIAGIWADDPEQIMATSKVLVDLRDSIDGAMMLILGFYFGGPHAAKLAEVIMGGMAKRKDG